MADPRRDGDTGVPGAGGDGGSAGGIAGWQKLVAIIGLVVLLGLGILLFGPGGGGHGPGRHAPADDTSGIQAPGGSG